MMVTRAHLADEVLLEYVEDRADAVSVEKVEAHLATGCAECAQIIAFWRRTLVALASDRMPAPPEWARQRAVVLFDRVERRPTAWQKLKAALVFDSRTQ